MKPPHSPDRLVQTNLTEEARAAVQKLADMEANGSVSRWVRTIVMRELWNKRDKLKKKSQVLVQPEPMEDVRRIRIDFKEPLAKQVHDSMSVLAQLSGESSAQWLRGVILREIHRQRRRLAAIRKTNGHSA